MRSHSYLAAQAASSTCTAHAVHSHLANDCERIQRARLRADSLMFAACRSVEEGIDSISLTPDALLRTTVKVLEIEDRQMIPHGEGTRPRHVRRTSQQAVRWASKPVDSVVLC